MIDQKLIEDYIKNSLDRKIPQKIKIEELGSLLLRNEYQTHASQIESHIIDVKTGQPINKTKKIKKILSIESNQFLSGGFGIYACRGLFSIELHREDWLNFERYENNVISKYFPLSKEYDLLNKKMLQMGV